MRLYGVKTPMLIVIVMDDVHTGHHPSKQEVEASPTVPCQLVSQLVTSASRRLRLALTLCQLLLLFFIRLVRKDAVETFRQRYIRQGGGRARREEDQLAVIASGSFLIKQPTPYVEQQQQQQQMRTITLAMPSHGGGRLRQLSSWKWGVSGATAHRITTIPQRSSMGTSRCSAFRSFARMARTPGSGNSSQPSMKAHRSVSQPAGLSFSIEKRTRKADI